jgi:hypothetical protein
VRQLRARFRRLQQRQLALCRVSGVLAQALRQANAELCLAPTFDEAAAQQCDGPFGG